MAAQQSNPFRNLDPIAGQIVDPIAFYAPNNTQSQVPFIHVMGPTGGWEPRMKRPKEEVLEGSQVSSLDFLKIGAVSTGLGLSLDLPSVASSSTGESGIVDDVLSREMQKWDAEIDSFVRLQGDRLRKSILEKFQAKQFQTLTVFEEKFLHKMREKEQQVQEITRKNMELEDQLRNLSYEVGMWQQQARNGEEMISALQYKLQQVCNRDANNQNNHYQEGCGESEVEDTASCIKGKGAIDFHLLCKEEKELMTNCKVCGVKDMCMLLLPCRHLCLCKDCEVKLNYCPVCQSSKLFGVEIFM